MGRLEAAQQDVAKAKRLEAIRKLGPEALPSPQPINDTAPNGKPFPGPIKVALDDLKARSDGNVAKSKDLEAVTDGISMTINQLEEAKGKSDAAIQAYEQMASKSIFQLSHQKMTDIKIAWMKVEKELLSIDQEIAVLTEREKVAMVDVYKLQDEV